ncbi:uncharacterized protein LOC115876558 [Sitophilus oryzae]|uniref:Uncharacterized protein LOC115876558 n=1 Tax=Sitophilus oryzae TaxID=7048 RepID=A0A6J2XAD5_SITOR|nr:uncharacterized protein LOC115876558 [Sitophilus oryzae]
MYKGYTVQPDLYDILLRFRTFKYVITSDIEKMYRQVRINPKHTYLHNILWREKPCEKLQCIELLTVTYGTNCAPYLATRVLKELAVINQKTFPLASNALLSQCYVDDILCGQDSYENLVELHRQLMQLCKLGNFHLHKWCSNSNSLLNNINHSHKSDISQENYDIKVDGISNKVLGIFWNPNLDVFSISLPIPSEEKQVTKREVLSKITQMFDPLGLIGPVIVIGKLMMQEIWKTKIDWDDFLEEDILINWKSYIHDMALLKSLKIPRFILLADKPISLELHGFSDASQKAYGACVYIRASYPNEKVSCFLITSKSRVAPIREITIPRLELCGAHLLSTLITKVRSVLIERLSFDSVNLWTDSEIVLAWLHSYPSRFQVFVSNRISQIQTLTQDCKWRYVSSKENPADLLSRGISPA